MFCVNCGTKFEGNFCPKCGTPAYRYEERATEEIKEYTESPKVEVSKVEEPKQEIQDINIEALILRSRDTVESIDVNKFYNLLEISWTEHKPCEIKLKDKVFNVRSFKDVLRLSIVYAYYKDKDNKEKMCKAFTGYQSRITTEPFEDGTCEKLKGIDLYVQTCLSAEAIQKFVARIFNVTGMDINDLSIRFAR